MCFCGCVCGYVRVSVGGCVWWNASIFQVPDQSEKCRSHCGGEESTVYSKSCGSTNVASGKTENNSGEVCIPRTLKALLAYM